MYPEYKSEYDREAKGEVPLIDCEYFDVNLVKADGHQDIAINHDSFMVIMCLEGECQIITDHGTITPMRRGETILVAAATASVEANGSATLLTAQA